MNRSVRGVTTALAVGFAVYSAARGIVWTAKPTIPVLTVTAIVLYAVVIYIAILGAPTRVKLPLWSATVALVASVLIPIALVLSLSEDDRDAAFSTWYIGGIGLLAVVCIVRRRFVIGWAMLLLLAATSSAHLGFGRALDLGLVGSFMWVSVAHLLLMFWDRAVRDTERLAEIQQAVSAWQATQVVRQRERRLRTQFALAVAGPTLSRVVAVGGELTEGERIDARLAEGRLRDELRGADLLNDAVRDAIEAARRRGAAVTVFDEGGLDGVDEQRRSEIRDELAQVISRTQADRLIIRSAKNEHTAVTVVGREGSGSSPDEDSVDVWHEIPRARPGI